jgi:putative flippase GtrA
MGVMATFIYALVGMVAVWANCPLNIAMALAFSVSLAFSYIGHHRFTFRVDGRHHIHGPRFILVTLVLVSATFLLSSILKTCTTIDHRIIVLITAIAYALASYVLNALWSYRNTAKEKPSIFRT